MDTDKFSTKRGLIQEWLLRAYRAGVAHYEAAKFLDRRHLIIGGVLIVFSAISTSLAGRTIFGISGVYLDGAMTVFSVLTFALACLHVFLRDSTRADAFRRSGAEYAAIKRRIEYAHSVLSESGDLDDGEFSRIRELLDTAGKNAPGIPLHIWKRIDAEMKTATNN